MLCAADSLDFASDFDCSLTSPLEMTAAATPQAPLLFEDVFSDDFTSVFEPFVLDENLLDDFVAVRTPLLQARLEDFELLFVSDFAWVCEAPDDFDSVFVEDFVSVFVALEELTVFELVFVSVLVLPPGLPPARAAPVNTASPTARAIETKAGNRLMVPPPSLTV